MKIEEYKSGNWESGYKYKYFVPSLINHSFSWEDESINLLLEQAALKLGALSAESTFVPNVDMFMLKEALLSNRIEGSDIGIMDALSDIDRISREKREDLIEVRNCVKAMNYAIEELDKLPFSCRFIRDAHRVLLSSGRGERKTPGEFRTSQNWIGGATIADAVFVPPAAEKLSELMTDFELFLNNDEINVPILIKIAIAHYQVETIHPFLDGNGRVGRLMIPLFFVYKGVLDKPILYLSEFFEKNRAVYYDKLSYTRRHNDLNQWIKYFLIGIIETASDGIKTFDEITKIKEKIENVILKMGKRAENGKKLLTMLFSKPIANIKDVSTVLGITPKTAGELVNIFVDEKILVEQTNNSRDRLFSFSEYINLFK